MHAILDQHVMHKHWHSFLFPSIDSRLGSCVPDEALVYSTLVSICFWQKKSQGNQRIYLEIVATHLKNDKTHACMHACISWPGSF